MAIEAGIIYEFEQTVEENFTAQALWGEGLPPVLSTPHMIAMLERASHSCILPRLPAGQSCVGTLVNVRHLAATPVGVPVRYRSELVEVEGRRLRFKVEAWDAVEKIADGEHERYIIDETRFIERLDKKAGQAKQ
jgi:predicted thioesterase